MTGKDYSHRKQWMINKLKELADTVKEYGESYHAFVGSEKQLKEVCESTGKKWLVGIKTSRVLYSGHT